MALRWTLLAAPSLLALLLGWALAWIVYSTRPDRPANRRLALALAAGSSLFFAYSGLRFLTTSPEEAYAATRLFALIDLCVPLLYGAFLATLDSPLARPLRHPLAVGAGVAYTAGAVWLWAAQPELFILGMERLDGVGVYGATRGVLWIPLLNLLPVAALLFGLAVAVSAYRRARGGLARGSAYWTMVAFGTRDLLTAIIIVIGATGGAATYANFVAFLGFPVVDVLHVSLLAYAMLRAQVFDIDLRLQLALRRGVLGAVFLVAFFITVEIAQAFFSTAYGIVAGGAAAGLLLLVARPLERAAERLSTAAMPHVSANPEYLSFRKCQVYEEAFVEMSADGSIGRKERAVLERLQRTMALAPETARAIEDEVLARRAGSPPAVPVPT